jgi:hypothetical protein
MKTNFKKRKSHQKERGKELKKVQSTKTNRLRTGFDRIG